MALMWTETPVGVASLGDALAWAVADHVAKDSVTVTCKDATEEERWEWGFSGLPDPLWQATRKAVREEYPSVLREIVGNPFRPISLAPAWLTPTVLKLAQATYDNRLLPSGHLDTGGLAILADAVEEAGCDNQDILSHLRGPGPHVRGCWAVDLLTGRG